MTDAESPPLDPPPEAPAASPATRPREHQVKLILGLVVVAALAAVFWPGQPQTTTAPGGFLIDGAGRPTPLGPRLAPVTLLHFWATWCPPCVVEIPALQRLQADFADRPRFRVALVAVEDQKSKVEDFLGAPAAATVLYDPEWEVANRYGTDKLPETYLVVRGEVVEKFVGATDWDDAEVRARIEQALASVS